MKTYILIIVFVMGFSGVVQAKTYYDWNDSSFKSVNESSGQTFNYKTGKFGMDYSR